MRPPKVAPSRPGARSAPIAALPTSPGDPAGDSPMWNICAALLREELRPLGAKVRLARYLGIPKQRITNFLTGHNRLPDAELTLQMLNWLAQKRAGRDLSI